jgi:hypothetical protein
MPFRFATSVLLILTIHSFTFCQHIEETKISKADYDNFKEAKLYVVLDLLDGRYDSAIKESVKDNWTYSEYEFIDTSDFRKLCDSASTFFFLVPCQLDKPGGSVDIETDDRPDQHFLFLKIIKGTPRYSKYLVGGAPRFYPTGIASVLYKLPVFSRKLDRNVRKPKKPVRQVNTIIEPVPSSDAISFERKQRLLAQNAMLSVLVRNLQLQCNNLVPGKTLSEFKRQREIYKSNYKIHSTPLYIVESDLSSELKSLEDIQEGYSGDVHLISRNELDSIVREKKDVNIVQYFSDDLKSYFRIFNVKSGEIIYLKRTHNGIRGIGNYHLKHWEALKARSR